MGVLYLAYRVRMYALSFYYLRWHYTTALTDYIVIVSNFLWFFYNFFSIPMLARTLFVPFHRLQDDTPRHGKLDVPAIAESVLVSLLMRLVGFFLRSILIVLGLVLLSCTLLFGAVFFVVWLIAPLLLALLVLFGIGLLFFF
jgi:hypothetical protein